MLYPLSYEMDGRFNLALCYRGRLLRCYRRAELESQLAAPQHVPRRVRNRNRGVSVFIKGRARGGGGSLARRGDRRKQTEIGSEMEEEGGTQEIE